MNSKGKLFVISGPSGAGKGTLVARLVDVFPQMWVSVSATTRSPREGEEDGISYYFLSETAFSALVSENGLLEWACYADNYYGTPRESVERHINEGTPVIVEIDSQGAMQIRDKVPDASLIFVAPPSMEELRNRLENRGSESPEAIEKRMATAVLEMDTRANYDFCLVNDNLDLATEELVGYISKVLESNEG